MGPETCKWARKGLFFLPQFSIIHLRVSCKIPRDFGEEEIGMRREGKVMGFNMAAAGTRSEGLGVRVKQHGQE